MIRGLFVSPSARRPGSCSSRPRAGARRHHRPRRPLRRCLLRKIWSFPCPLRWSPSGPATLPLPLHGPDAPAYAGPALPTSLDDRRPRSVLAAELRAGPGVGPTLETQGFGVVRSGSSLFQAEYEGKITGGSRFTSRPMRPTLLAPGLRQDPPRLRAPPPAEARVGSSRLVPNGAGPGRRPSATPPKPAAAKVRPALPGRRRQPARRSCSRRPLPPRRP